MIGSVRVGAGEWLSASDGHLRDGSVMSQFFVKILPAAHRDAFLVEPIRYAPQYGG